MQGKRRRFVIGALGVTGALAAAAAWRYWPEHGVVNPCRGALPGPLAGHAAVRAAWEGVAADRMWDCHVHLVGTGDSDSGIWLNPHMHSVAHPLQYAQRLFYLNAGCADATPGQTDSSYVERLRALVGGMPRGTKLMLLAFDRHYTVDGEPVPSDTPFYIPNEYAQRVARLHPGAFEWIASIHPYRADCVAALRQAHAGGARAVKWLPAAMGIDPASPRCDAFYAAMAALDLPLITHAGMERAMSVGDRHRFGNPLLLRRALEHGVRVVVAHCATLGQDHDLDRSPQGPLVDSFELFARMMDDQRYDAKLYGDLSAITQLNRVGPSLARLIERNEWHGRLINGSDYPLPGVMPLYSMERMVAMGYLEAGLAPVLASIREHNPLLFDFVLKRHLRANNKRFSSSVFETRPFFERQRSAASIQPSA